jgi:hypothetical protein
VKSTENVKLVGRSGDGDEVDELEHSPFFVKSHEGMLHAVISSSPRYLTA